MPSAYPDSFGIIWPLLMRGLPVLAPESMDTPGHGLMRVDLYSLGGILQWLFRDELHNDTQPQMNTLGQVITRSHAHDAGSPLQLL